MKYVSRPFIIYSDNIKDILPKLDILLENIAKLTDLNIRKNIVYEDNRCIIGYLYVCDGIEKYPIHINEIENKIIITEGYTYNIDLNYITEKLTLYKDLSRMFDLLRIIDGEYSILIFDPSSKSLKIIVDRFSTLPYYYTVNSRERRSLIVSRHPLICLADFRDIKISKEWFIERLVFGYPCTYTFIFERIFKTKPASVTTIQLENRSCKAVQWCQRYDVFYSNYDPAKLVAHLFQSCDNRIRLLTAARHVKKILVKLSGG
ncbi:MAG: hypothetical protein GXO10_00715, partial [Crenarchaeota archaeon]|nr:hypothetical protein [Thermoproteota archaeon]